MRNQQLNRREFIYRSALAAGGIASGSPLLYAATRRISATEKLNIGIIGAGGRGFDNLNGVRSENIVALCDVDDQNAAEAYKQFPNARHYKDYRQMLDKEKTLDAVTVSVPDHSHAMAATTAMR